MAEEYLSNPAPTNGKNGYSIDEERLTFVIRTVLNSLETRKKIFRNGIRPFLPQWNLPKEFEYDPQRTILKDPENAAKVLFTRTSIDKMSDSGYLNKQTLKTWAESGTRWIFNPKEVVKRDEKEIGALLKRSFSYALPISPKLSAARGYLQNAFVLAEEYDSDPRNLIQSRTVEESRTALMSLSGWGTGLANLLIIEFGSRELVFPTDPYNIRPKIDRHKARIPLNTDSVISKNPQNGWNVHANDLTLKLEEAYLRISQREGLPMQEVDAALWIIGSEICMRSSYYHCDTKCPLANGICKANTVLNGQTGYFEVYDSYRNRIDSRGNRPSSQKHKGQSYLEIF